MHDDKPAEPAIMRPYQWAWTAPHEDALRARRNLGWEETTAGRYVYEELASRGLSEADVCLFRGQDVLIISPPASLAVAGPVILRSNEIPSDAGNLTQMLDLVLANLARETMMRKTGWKTGDQPLAWSLVTTPLTEALVSLAGVTTHEMWRFAEHDREFKLTLPIDDGECLDVEFERRGCGLFTSLCELCDGITIIEDRGSCLVVDPALIKHPAQPVTGSVLGDVVNLTGIPLRAYLSGLSIASVSVVPWSSCLIVNLSMGLRTMANVPYIALAKVGIYCTPGLDQRSPLWTEVKRLRSWVPALPLPAAAEAVVAAEPSVMLEIEPEGGVLTEACARTIGKQPACWQGEVGATVEAYLGFRHQSGDDMANVLNEHVVLGRVWVGQFLNSGHPDRGALTLSSPHPSSFERRIQMAEETAPEVRALRAFYSDLVFDGLRADSPLASKHWDEPVRMQSDPHPSWPRLRPALAGITANPLP